MITTTTPSDQILAEMRDEHRRVIYWMRKQFGGDKKYEKMRDALLARAVEKRESQASEPVEYKSPRGNRWIAFEYAIYYKDAHTSHTMPYAFCYYETYASVGAFIPGFLPGSEHPGEIASCLIYTDHFFLRFCDRLGIQMRSSTMIKSFIQCVPQQMVTLMDEYGDNGLRKMYVRIPGSVGRGFVRRDNDRVYEIRTYLTDKQMNNKQLRETAPGRTAGDVVKYEPDSVRIARVLKDGNLESELESQIRQAKALGVPEDYMRRAYEYQTAITVVFMDMGIADPLDTKFWQRHGNNAAGPVFDFTERWHKQGSQPSEKFLPEFVALGERIAKLDNIKKFSRNKFAYYTLKTLYQWDADKAQTCADAFFGDSI